jgi:hypothetical protein
MSEELILKLPNGYKLPEYVGRFSVNENFLMLKLGSEIVFSSTKEILDNQLINIRIEITNEIQQKFKTQYTEQITFLQNQLTIFEQQRENEIKRRIDDNLHSVEMVKSIYVNSNKELNDKIIDIMAQSKVIEDKYNNEKKLIESQINEEVFKRVEQISAEKLRTYDDLIAKKDLQDQELIKLKEKLFLLENDNNNKIVKLEHENNTLLMKKSIEITQIQNEKNNEIKLREIAIDNLQNQIKEFNNKINKEIELINSECNNKIQTITKDKNIQLFEKEKMINDLNNKILLNNTEWINKSKTMVEDELSEVNIQHENKIDELEFKLEQQTEINKQLNQQIFTLKEQQLKKDNALLNQQLEQQKTKSKETTYLKGSVGESLFKQMAKDAFRFLDSFDIVDTFNLAQMGDFHLKFENFDVLVDVKNYENSVPKSQREKIKNDLSFGKNKKIKFGWLISLYSEIDGFSRGSPFEIEIITHQPITNQQTTTDDEDITTDNETMTQYIFYINHLNNNPTEILLSILSCCKTIHKITSEINDDFTVSRYKEYEQKVKNNVVSIIENNKNVNKMFNDMKKMFSDNDKFLQNILNNELNTIFKYNITVIDWCKKNLQPIKDKEVSIKDIFKVFTDENVEMSNIKFELFTQIIMDYYKKVIKIVKMVKSEKVMICGFLLKR